jgi:hypothetical protein
MVDINSYFKSLKVSWVKRLLSSETSKQRIPETTASYIDLHLEIDSEDPLRTQLYEKSNLPAAPAYATLYL